MASNYAAIRADNVRRYGTDIARYGQQLFSARYDDKTHFVYELLQNAEDALARRSHWEGSRSVTFQLTDDTLRFSHFGEPFNEADVRGICGVDESTKDTNAIGRFGIGFKSVYAFTKRPEVHSGDEDFAIEDYVRPAPAAGVGRRADETVILLPLKASGPSDYDDIAVKLSSLGSNSLLFLRQIEQIE